MDLRCDNGIKFGELDPEELTLEVKCRSRLCGARPGVVVIHEFDLLTGKELRTRTFRDPAAQGG
jgi:hypothetical protein